MKIGDSGPRCPICKAETKVVDGKAELALYNATFECPEHGEFGDFGERFSFRTHGTDVAYRESKKGQRDIAERKQRMK